MALALTGRTVALAEGRQLEELAQMLEKDGATTLRCPMVSILDAPNEDAVVAWLQQLCSGRFDYVILLTGEGVRRLLGVAERHGLRDQAIAALSRTMTVTRGPKPVQALKAVGLAPALVAESPTTEGVINTLNSCRLKGTTVGVQLYAESNPPLLDFLSSEGANVAAVLPYVYAPAADSDRVADLIQRLARGEVDAIVFTSSPQVDRLLEVATERNLLPELTQGWQKTRVAAVGPVVSDHLQQRGAPVHLSPEKGFVMKNLVQLIRRDLGAGI